MIDKTQLESLIVRVTTDIGLCSEAATQLLLGTAAQESQMGTYLRQLGGGPALGIFQMEPATHDDIWGNYLAYHGELKKKVERYVSWRSIGGSCSDCAEELEWNLAYAVAMARVHYQRVPQPLPSPEDLAGLAGYWKSFYNTPAGKGTVGEFLENYRRYVSA